MERYILTVESFENILGLLSSGGFFYVSAWTDYPHRTSLKLLSTLARAMENKGLAPEKHIIAVRDWNMIHFIASQSPLNLTQKKQIREFCRDLRFDIALMYGVKREEMDRYHRLMDDSYFYFLQELLSENRDHFSNRYKFNIYPPTDDKPFFHNFITPSSAKYIIRQESIRDFSFMELGYLILMFTLIQVSLAAFILVLLPLFLRGSRLKQKFFPMTYFCCLGLGFIFLEIILIHKFTFYFGSPVYAAAFVIAFLLSSAGIGSYISSSFQIKKNNIIKVSFAVFGMVGLYTIFLDRILLSTASLDMLIKIPISLLLILPAGFLLGMPFPLGMGYIGRENPDSIPWCWGIDGSFSVIGAVLASIISLHFGFSNSLAAIAFLYLAAGMTAFTLD